MCSDDDIDFLLQSGGQPSPSQAPDVVPTSLGFHKPMPKSKHWTVEMVYTTSEEEETGPHPSPHASLDSGMDAKCGVSVCMCMCVCNHVKLFQQEEETGPHPSPHALVEVSGMDAHFSKCGVSVCMCIVGVTM